MNEQFWVAVIGVGLGVIYRIIDADRQKTKEAVARARVEGALLRAVSEHGRQLGQLTARVTDIEKHIERRLEPKALCALAREVAKHTSDPNAQALIRSILDRYDQKPPQITVLADKI